MDDYRSRLVLLILGLVGCATKVNMLFSWKLWRRDWRRRRGKNGESSVERRKLSVEKEEVCFLGIDVLSLGKPTKPTLFLYFPNRYRCFG